MHINGAKYYHAQYLVVANTLPPMFNRTQSCLEGESKEREREREREREK